MPRKSDFIQIRVSPADKARLKRMARLAGQDLSSYLLARALPGRGDRFMELVRSLADSAGDRYVLAELNDFLTSLAPFETAEALEHAEVARLSPLLANYLAAMVEQASEAAGVGAPAWTRTVPPLERPHFAVSMPSLRLHLLAAAPVPFKRRNIFIDASLGSRV